MSAAIKDNTIGSNKNRYRDVPRNLDYTIDQHWSSYSAAEYDRWDRLLK
jgi:phenylalanine-4-hydroxylase